MSRKAAVHHQLQQAVLEVLGYMKEREFAHADRWLPAAAMKQALGLVTRSVAPGGHRSSADMLDLRKRSTNYALVNRGRAVNRPA